MIALLDSVPANCPSCGGAFRFPTRSVPKIAAGLAISHHCGPSFVVLAKRWLMTAVNSAATNLVYQDTDVGL